MNLNLFTPSAAAKSDRPKHASGELIIKMGVQGNIDDIKNKFRIKNSKNVLGKFNLNNDKIKKSGLDRLYKVEVDANEDVVNLSRQLQADSNIEYAEPNFEVSATVIPNDPSFSLLWGLNNTGQSGGKVDADIDAPEGWDINTNSSQLLVGIIDTGVGYNHPDLQSNMWVNQAELNGQPGVDDDGDGFVDDIHGYDFANNDPDPLDDHGHGTHVAGTIGAVGNNGIGVAGINWSAKIMAIKFLNSSGSGYIDGAVQALFYANMMGAKITNNSWGGGGYSQALADAISAADAGGNLFIAAAGNSAANNDLYPFYPASYTNKNVMAVAATDTSDNLASFSSFGATSVHMAAPGVSIYSTVPTGSCNLCNPSGYRYLSGTSMATPHVVGSAALIWAHSPLLTHDQVKAKLIATSDKMINLSDKSISGGRLNLLNNFEDDSTPPSPIADLQVAGSSYNSVTLSWAATGDDGNSGRADQYDIRFSTSQIDSLNFNSSQKMPNPPQPQTAGTAQTVVIKGLSEQTAYYFAIKSIDNMGNMSDISNIVSATTTVSRIVFDEDFEASPSGWVVEGSTGDASASGALWHLSERRFASPTHAFYYGREDTGTFDTGYRNWGNLISPVIDLSKISNPSLVFKHFLATENGAGYLVNYDRASVQLSGDGGLHWSEVMLKSSTGGSWMTENLDLSGFYSNSLMVRFSFDSVDSMLNYYEGWFVDDVKLIGSPDITAPTAKIISPADNSQVTATITIEADVSDDIGVTMVDFLVDGTVVAGDSTAPYMINYDTSQLAQGSSHVITANAYDAASNMGSSDPVNILIKDLTPPVVSLTAPAPNAYITGTVTMAADASDNVGVLKVDFMVDGNVYGSDATMPYSFDLNTSAFLQGTNHSISAYAYDEAGNLGFSSQINVKIKDVTVPTAYVTFPTEGAVVSGIINITADAADNIGVTMVDFLVDGVVVGRDSFAPYNFNFDTSFYPQGSVHTVSVYAYDQMGNRGFSPVVSFRNRDFIAPIVKISAPADNSTVSGIINLAVDASDNVGVTMVDFLVNGVVVARDSIAPFEVSYDTTILDKGSSYMITANAYDANSNMGLSQPVTFKVADITPPTVAMTNPLNNSNISGLINLTADATDNIGVTMVDFLLDGVVVGRDSISPYAYSWDSNYSVGQHTLSANAYDGAGNMKPSVSVNVTVLDVQAPAITITNPTNNSTIKRGSTTTITTNTSDNVGVAKVEFYVNNALKCTDTAAPYSCNWLVPSKPNVVYTVVGIAYDGAGNNSGVSIKTTSK